MPVTIVGLKFCLSGMPLAFALHVVLEALRKEANSKMWYFGVCALDKFRTRLKLHPRYCQNITQIPSYNTFPTTLRQVGESFLTVKLTRQSVFSSPS